ncbi:YiiX family permuted papain-like enzyme [Prevotella sp. 10(H)]|uniref:YiiX family permuted papain-like enzyme n=1 Tax=Prevotella sp. 10(H) TaxID=1158294 RepID=UPI0004A6DDCE|nr:YiiX family permuted papain-like enzyme [Prevotella sp. 10(H)]
MKKWIVLISFLLLLVGLFFIKGNYFYSAKKALFNSKNTKQLITDRDVREGDIIFQESLSSQSRAIQLATKSKYSHCGIIYKSGDKYYVFEAVQPVKLTPLDKWIKRGKDSHYVVKRLKNNELLTSAILKRMKKEGEKFMGKSYDLTFEWSDDKIYCSELIWKIYKRGLNIEVGKLQTLKDFGLSNKIVKQKLQERYKDNIPLGEIVISPVSIFESDKLETVISN